MITIHIEIEGGRKIAPIFSEYRPNDDTIDEKPLDVAYCYHCGLPIVDEGWTYLGPGAVIHDVCDYGGIDAN